MISKVIRQPVEEIKQAETKEVEEAEIKQSVIEVEKKKTSHLNIAGFKGSYKAVQFDDDGNSNIPVTQEILAELKTQFPKAVIKEVSAPQK